MGAPPSMAGVEKRPPMESACKAWHHATDPQGRRSMKWKTWFPHRGGKKGITALVGQKVNGKFYQLLGGRTWSLCLIRKITPSDGE